MIIVDLLSILPSISMLSNSFKIFKVFRMFKVFRVFKFIRYSKSINRIQNAFSNQKKALLAVLALAFTYILVSSLLVFTVEPDTFTTFFEAFYWAVVSLTTMGYGDIYPLTPIGRMVTVLSSILGIAIVALPSGIITAGYMQELENNMRNWEYR